MIQAVKKSECTYMYWKSCAPISIYKFEKKKKKKENDITVGQI